MSLLRGFKQKFGIAAPRVAVRAHVPWYWRWFGVIALAAALVGGALATYDPVAFSMLLQRDSIERQRVKLESALRGKERELDLLRARSARAERQLEIERGASADLTRQLKSLSEENAALKEDLAFFQTVMQTGTRKGAITIDRFKLHHDTLPGEYSYRFLLVHNGQRDEPFEGRFQLIVHMVDNGKEVVVALPESGEAGARDYQLKFRYFQRLEGTFKVAPDALVKSLQVRIFEKAAKAPKLAQTIKVF